MHECCSGSLRIRTVPYSLEFLDFDPDYLKLYGSTILFLWNQRIPKNSTYPVQIVENDT